MRRKQVSTELQPRTRPSLRQVAELKRRLPQWRHPGDLSVLLKNVYAFGRIPLRRIPGCAMVEQPSADARRYHPPLSPRQ